jgi:hypothetical protein
MKTHKLSVWAVAVLVAMIFSTFTTKVVAGEWRISAGTILMSKYYGTIFGGTFYNGPMSFTDIRFSKDNKLGTFSLDLSAGQKLDRLDTFNVDGGNEYDVLLNQSMKLGPAVVTFGLSYLAIYDLNEIENDVFSQDVRVDLPIKFGAESVAFTPYLQIYHYNEIGGLSDKGCIGYCGMYRDQPLGFSLFSKNATLNIDYRMGMNFGVYDSQQGIEYHRLAVSLPISIGKWSITPSIIGQIPGSSDQTYVHTEEVFGTISIRRLLH